MWTDSWDYRPWCVSGNFKCQSEIGSGTHGTEYTSGMYGTEHTEPWVTVLLAVHDTRLIE